MYVPRMTPTPTRAHREQALETEHSSPPPKLMTWLADGDLNTCVGAHRFERIAQALCEAEHSGYLKRQREEVEAHAHGRALLLEIGGGSEECWQQNDKTFENAAPLADALARVVGYPQRDENGDCFYPEASALTAADSSLPQRREGTT